ncbi:MAG TPA: capsule assembly Wzi family protein [Terriglobia bacterium]|nr:capsule assembly Wzi family protein [Terriglobia bacterium]
MTGKDVTAILRILVCVWALALSLNMGVAEGPPGSVYVPLDNWVYAAFDRLAALGTVNKQFVGLRPWTRMQCAESVLDADQNMLNADVSTGESMALYDALQQEFSVEIDILSGGSARQAGVESVYTRSMGITGTPLRDGYNFGQTLWNDFGRPFNTGFNNVTGFSAQAVRGRFFAYIRGEYQNSPGYAGLTGAQQSYLEQLDGTPSAPYSQAAGTVSRVALLDTYVGMRLGHFDVTIGKQSQWWGPGTMGGMLFSDNSDPVPMLKVNQVEPTLLPGILEHLGPVRVQAFMGRLSGNQYPRGPYIHGEKILFKPTPNLEVGISRTTEAFGQGIPFTFRNLFATYFSVTDICCVANPQDYPGKRQGGLDFSYRLPHLRQWVTLYSDNFSEDDINPVVNPSRAMFNPGIYLSQVPHLRKLDFRFELANTHHHEEAYTSFFYKQAYTNKGFLIGNAVGRRGSAFDVSSTYWFSPRKRVQVGWREQKVSQDLIPSGGSQNSLRVQAAWFVQKELEFSFLAQHELWVFPFLATRPQSDNVVSLQFAVYPKKLWSRAGR